MQEVFKPIKGYENLYEISNFGNVKSLSNNSHKKELILKLYKNTGGYLYIGLRKHNKTQYFRIHRLVASVFILNPKLYLDINHKDSSKENNNANNLEWCSCRYNRNHYLKTQNCSSKYSGVSWDKDVCKWRARIKIEGKQINLGFFTNEVDAAQAYQKVLKELQLMFN